MMKMLGAAVAATFVLATTPAAAGNIFVNGDFEAGNTAFGSALTYSPGSLISPGTFDVSSDPQALNPAFADLGGTGDGKMLVVNGIGDVFTQTATVDANKWYFLSFRYFELTPLPIGASMSWLVTGGGSIGGSSTSAPVDGWRTTIVRWNSGDLTQAALALNAYGYPQQVAYDDIALSVPEPSTWAMLIAGFGLAGAALRRRRYVRVVA
jgi:hypothetical protein